ncbi:MAG TPA: LamG domain-containing protein [Kofleriaceae bacterium]|jgi:hypothetical protein
MRSGGVSLVVLGACGFHSPSEGTFCDPADPHVIVCFDFEGEASDGSSNHLDATATNVGFSEGRAGMAMRFGTDSAVDVADSPVLDVANLTIEAWIQPWQLPTLGNRAGILDVNGQYGMFLHSLYTMVCSFGGGPAAIAASPAIAPFRWSHIACTYDRKSAVLYINGSPVARSLGSAAPSTAGTTGMSIGADNPPGSGSHWIGLLDQVRLVDVARTAQQICSDAGRSSCP